ncbi:MAG: hypothetical protein E6Q43_05625 [Dokdonella sp.]|nr:MAG: hypothetical protein EYC71_00495 [Gammaproteobacteria bacterium]TXI73335.1 MAG: hypothetical protein E6Q43_05625 [Dokdonella sp.]
MAKLLLNLRHVPEDEAADVRAMLVEHDIGYYETEPNRWGISAGAIWIKDDSRHPDAMVLMSAYQGQRSAHARAQREQARIDGSAETLAQQIKKQPLRLVFILFALAILVALSLWPLLLMGAS